MFDLESLFNLGIAYLVGILVGLVIIYIVLSIFLYKFHRLTYGKGTILVWLPVFGFQPYFLGKLAVNKAMGWILFVLNILASSIVVSGHDITVFKTEALRARIGTTTTIVEIVLLIYAIIKYYKVKKIAAESYGGVLAGGIPNGPMKQTNPFANQNQYPSVPGYYSGPTMISQNGVILPVDPQEQANAAAAPAQPKFAPGVTIDSIIHHEAPPAPTTEEPVETLDLNPEAPQNPNPVDTNNPNNM